MYNYFGDFMKYFKLCEYSEELAKELMNSDIFQELLRCKEEINLKYQKEMANFKKMEEKYLEVKSYGKYHPDYQKYAKAFCDAKDLLFSLPVVKRYKELERLFQEKLNEVVDIIKESIKS